MGSIFTGHPGRRFRLNLGDVVSESNSDLTVQFPDHWGSLEAGEVKITLLLSDREMAKLEVLLLGEHERCGKP